MPSTFTEERELIEGHFLNNFDNTTIPIQFDNISGLLLGDIMVDQDDVDKWVRLSIRNYDNTPTTVGYSGCSNDRIYGEVIINIFTRENTGSNDNRIIIDSVFPIFNRVSVGDILFRNAVLTSLPPSDGWYNSTLTIEFQYDKC